MIADPHKHKEALYAAYLALAGRYHPDVVKEPKDAAEAHFRKIEEAHEILRDALQRWAYDNVPPNQHVHAVKVSAPHPDKVAFGDSQQGGKIERFIKRFLVAAVVLFFLWIVNIPNRLLPSPPQPSNQNRQSDVARAEISPQPNPPLRSTDQNHQSDPRPLRSDPSQQSSPASQPSDQKHDAVPDSLPGRPWLADGEPTSRPAPPHRDYRGYSNFPAWRFHDSQPRRPLRECWRDRSMRVLCF
jgi:DnaJ-like protein